MYSNSILWYKFSWGYKVFDYHTGNRWALSWVSSLHSASGNIVLYFISFAWLRWESGAGQRGRDWGFFRNKTFNPFMEVFATRCYLNCRDNNFYDYLSAFVASIARSQLWIIIICRSLFFHTRMKLELLLFFLFFHCMGHCFPDYATGKVFLYSWYN